MNMSKNIFIGKTVVTKALAGKEAKGLVYFLHGPCDTGVGLQKWVNNTINGSFAFRNFPVVYPSSPIRSYSLHEGKKECVWFDQLALNPNFPEDYGSINYVSAQLNELMEDCEARTGVPQENIIIGGFSMGGAMALHLGFKFNPNIAGVFALSSFLPPDSLLYADMELKGLMHSPEIKLGKGDTYDAFEETLKNLPFPKLFMSHGEDDPIIPLRWAKHTFFDLRRRGVDGHFYTMENTQHCVSKQQLSLLHDWIEDILYKKITSASES